MNQVTARPAARVNYAYASKHHADWKHTEEAAIILGVGAHRLLEFRRQGRLTDGVHYVQAPGGRGKVLWNIALMISWNEQRMQEWAKGLNKRRPKALDKDGGIVGVYRQAAPRDQFTPPPSSKNQPPGVSTLKRPVPEIKEETKSEEELTQLPWLNSVMFANRPVDLKEWATTVNASKILGISRSLMYMMKDQESLEYGVHYFSTPAKYTSRKRVFWNIPAMKKYLEERKRNRDAAAMSRALSAASVKQPLPAKPETTKPIAEPEAPEQFYEHVGKIQANPTQRPRITYGHCDDDSINSAFQRASSISFREYQDKSMETAIYPSIGGAEIYPALELANEAGEVLGKIKKVYRDKGGVFAQDVLSSISSELGDVLWAMSQLATELGLDLEEIAVGNLDKLKDRKERGALAGSGDQR